MAVKILLDPVEPGINTATHVEAPLLGKVDGKNVYLDLDTNMGGYSSWSLKGMFDGDIAEVCSVGSPLLLSLANALPLVDFIRNWRSSGFSQPIKGV